MKNFRFFSLMLLPFIISSCGGGGITIDKSSGSSVCILCRTSGDNTSYNATKGNKVLVTQDIVISDYSSMALSVPGDVHYSQVRDEAAYFQITTDENILPLLDISVRHGCLQIKKHENIRPSQLTIHTRSGDINKINIAGRGKIRLIETVATETLEMKISGSGEIVSEQLCCASVQANISGSGNIRIAGSGSKAAFSISGSGKILGEDYNAGNLTCKISGSGTINTGLSEILNAKISGSGHIGYKSCPNLDISISGSGKLNHIQ
jgi:hypothetical protein